jgi:hypothetical protein
VRPAFILATAIIFVASGLIYLQPERAAGEERRFVSDDDAHNLMYALTRGTPEMAREATDTMVRSGDPQFIPVFIEMLRAFIYIEDRQVHINALETLSGESFGRWWPAWMEWYGATEITPPPGFTGWKGDLFSRINSELGAFLSDDVPSRIRAEEIAWGGVMVDGIPPLDDPIMIPATDAGYLDPSEPVFGIVVNGDARAYPMRIMDHHEMANDVIGGVPVSLAYCTLCGAAIAYEGRGPDGSTFTFGTSGMLYRSNKLMYDRPTRTLWNHLTGEPVLGPLAAEEFRLKVLPIVLTSWHDWTSRHPDTLVLSFNTGFERQYVAGQPYGDYYVSGDTMFPVWQRSGALRDKEHVFALYLDGVAKAYPIEVMVTEGIVNDSLGSTNVVLIAGDRLLRVEGEHHRTGPIRYTAGGEVRAYERHDETFRTGDEPGTLLDTQDRQWEITEEALLGPAGERLERLPGHLAYWFGWFAFHPLTEVYSAGE